LEWYSKSANANNLSAMYYLGDYLIAGEGARSRNAKIGVEWLKKAADFGDRFALNRLGEVYSDGTVKEDEPRASRYFLEAAERGDVAAMYAIAGRLAVGTGIDKDDVAAFKWYEKAAANGHNKATIRLAICYSSGKGVARDAKKAFKFFKQAAVDDDMEAIANLAVCYASGLGTAVNEEESTRLYLEVLNSGNQTAIAIVEVLKKEEE
jgi:TPR repeat protein